MSQEDAHAQEEDFIAQRIQEDQGWVRTQTKTFTRWVNENLKTTEHKVSGRKGPKLVTKLSFYMKLLTLIYFIKMFAQNGYFLNSQSPSPLG